jgi:2-furoyl-CoA dehydrogenase FAD binding subunit
VCGSISHADPSAELPLCLATLGGTVQLRSRRHRRSIPAGEFFQGVLTTAREADELVESVQFPMAGKLTRYGFVEISMRHGDFALVALAGVVSDSAIQLGIGGVADRPWVETLPSASAAELDAALENLAWKLGAQDDQHASARYRRHLVRNLGKTLITKLSTSSTSQ